MESKDNEINNEDNILLTKEFVVDKINPGLNSLEDNKTTESVKKKFNKKVLFIVLGVVLLILILFLLWYFLIFNKDDNDESHSDNNNNNNQDNNVEDVVNDKYISIYEEVGDDGNKYSFDGELEPIYKIKCEYDNCDGLLVNDTYVILKDGDYSYIYDYRKEKKLLGDLKINEALEIKYSTDSSSMLYGFLLKSTNNLYGVYNISEGGITVPLQYEKLETIDWNCESRDDDASLYVHNDMIKFVTNGKVGVIDTKIHKVIVDDENDCVRFGNNDEDLFLYTVNKNKRTAYNLSGKKLLGGGSYDEIYFYTKDNGEYAIVKNGSSVILVNNEGELVANMAEYKDGDNVLMAGYEDNEISKKAYIVLEKSNDNKCVEYYYDFNSDQVTLLELGDCGGYAKPIIYLYPKKKTNVKITFEKPSLLTTTYPKYTTSWEVLATPNGSLYDDSGKYYYGLYYEEVRNHTVEFNYGFYVEGDKAIDFLEEKLAIIGLNERESNEFIMYWLPIMEKNKHNLVYFELTDERDYYSKINISPKPDSILRMAMHLKKVDGYVKIKEQKLPTFERNGFTVVEWGGVSY